MAAHALSLVLFSVFVASHLAATAAEPDGHLVAVCNITRYPALCVSSLARFSRAASKSPSPESPRLWARAAVSVALEETERVRRRLASAARRERRRRQQPGGALGDCAECFGNAAAELHGALAELRRLRESTFGWQMSNVETWVTAAETDQQTCLDGFDEEDAAPEPAPVVPAPEPAPVVPAPAAAGGKKRRAVPTAVLRGMVTNATCLSSNALALINKLASSGIN